MDYIGRQNKLLRILESKSLDALLIRKKQNISYLTGTKGEDAILFASSKKNFLITDARHKEECTSSIKNSYLMIVTGEHIWASIGEVSKKTRSRRIGFESNNFSYSEYKALKKILKNKKLVPIKEMIESLRMIKDVNEINCIKSSCGHSCDIMRYGIKAIRPPITEMHVKNRIEEYIAKKGFKRADFEIIVASGKNASMPHASASKRNIKKKDLVLIDLGAMNYGYNSDLTRTVFLGRIDRKYLEIYNIVLDSQKKAIEKIRPGVQAKYIDNISRQYIIRKNLGKYFIHSLGHGIGLEVHENPSISRDNNTVLEANMTITVEPGIYIPGWGGVRIEDVVLITKNGCEVLTKLSAFATAETSQ